MTLDKFGRYLSHRRANRIYLIQEAGYEQVKQHIDQKVQEAIKDYVDKSITANDLITSKEVGEAIGRAESLLGHRLQQSFQDTLKDYEDRIRQICTAEDRMLRCAMLLPFTAVAGADPRFYDVNGRAYLEIRMDCKILMVGGSDFLNFNVHIHDSRGKVTKINSKNLVGYALEKGMHIYVVQHPALDNISSFFLLEYIPWNVNDTPLFQ